MGILLKTAGLQSRLDTIHDTAAKLHEDANTHVERCGTSIEELVAQINVAKQVRDAAGSIK